MIEQKCLILRIYRSLETEELCNCISFGFPKVRNYQGCPMVLFRDLEFVFY